MSLWSFRRDFLERAINKYELTQLVNLVNSPNLKKQDQRVNLDFKGFEQFIIQVAMFSHSRVTPAELVYEEQKLKKAFDKAERRREKARKKLKKKFKAGKFVEEEKEKF